jgi:hypothetical protein
MTNMTADDASHRGLIRNREILDGLEPLQLPQTKDLEGYRVRNSSRYLADGKEEVFRSDEQLEGGDRLEKVLQAQPYTTVNDVTPAN